MKAPTRIKSISTVALLSHLITYNDLSQEFFLKNTKAISKGYGGPPVRQPFG
jgi:hypothetical protein